MWQPPHGCLGFEQSFANAGVIPRTTVAKAVGWKGARPTPAPGLRVTAFAEGLDHPRWLYVLPNGDVLVAESNAPPKPGAKGIKAWIMKKVMAKAGANDRVTDAAIVVPSAVLAGALFALLTGAIAIRTTGVHFIMITLAFAQMLFYLFVSLRQYGGEDGIPRLYTMFRTHVRTMNQEDYNLVRAFEKQGAFAKSTDDAAP